MDFNIVYFLGVILNNKNLNTKRLCIIDTPYSLFLYFLICGVNKDDIFVMSNHISKDIRNNINPIYFPYNIFYSDNSSIKNFFMLFKLRIILYFKTRNCNVEVYGHAHLLFSFPLYEYENSYIIEDGIGNYADLPIFKEFSPLKKFIYEKFFGKYFDTIYDGFGNHPNIKKIYLTKDSGFSDLIKDKVEFVDLNNLINSLTSDEKAQILKIFNADDILNENIPNNSILLLTEAFYESNYLSLDEEIDIYNEMISKYDLKDIVIKPHPSDQKDYTKFFPGVKVIKTRFPMELFGLLGIKFKKILTIHSSAALNFTDVEIEFYDGEINNEMVNKTRIKLKKQYDELINRKVI